MTESLVTCYDTDGIFDCITKMKDAKVRRIPIVDKTGKAIGILSAADLLTVLAKEFDFLASAATIRGVFEQKAA
jgi:predicted transcriptional regulator